MAHYARTDSCPDDVSVVSTGNFDIDVSADRVPVDRDATALFEQAVRYAAYAVADPETRDEPDAVTPWFEKVDDEPTEKDKADDAEAEKGSDVAAADAEPEPQSPESPVQPFGNANPAEQPEHTEVDA